ncbi:MAG: hypothetical protein NTV56_08805 [Alphaproteobacteria bacterium]|nr:hypothetical protein [Alphaproteobacteria bacterium]
MRLSLRRLKQRRCGSQRRDIQHAGFLSVASGRPFDDWPDKFRGIGDVSGSLFGAVVHARQRARQTMVAPGTLFPAYRRRFRAFFFTTFFFFRIEAISSMLGSASPVGLLYLTGPTILSGRGAFGFFRVVRLAINAASAP